MDAIYSLNVLKTWPPKLNIFHVLAASESLGSYINHWLPQFIEIFLLLSFLFSLLFPWYHTFISLQ